MWIAKKQQQVKRGGTYVTVYPGDPIPEADTWPNQKTWIDGGFIKWVERGAPAPAKPVAVKTVKAAPAKKTQPSKPKKRGRPKKSGVKKPTVCDTPEKVEE